MDGRQREREWDELKMQVRKDVGKGKGMKQAEGMNTYEEEEGGNRQLMMHKEGLGKFWESHNTTTSTTTTTAAVVIVAAAPAA